MASEFDSGILGADAPLKCGCQELLSSSLIVTSGWLRKKCLRNKLFIKIFNWPHVFVIIKDKCIYYFKNELSKKASGSASLYGFNRIIRSTNILPNDPPWSFKLEHIQPDIRSLCFATTSEKDMIKWMRIIKQEMLITNHKETGISQTGSYSDAMSEMSWASSDYKVLETSIYIEPTDTNQLSSSSDLSEEFDEIDDVHEFDDEDEFAEERAAANSTLASIFQNDLVSRNEQHRPTDPPGYTLQRVTSNACDHNLGSSLFWTSIHFPGNKQEASRLITSLGENGVFLVRKSEDNFHVLVCFSNGCKKYKIFKRAGGQMALQMTGPVFDNLEKLLYHYCRNYLPNTDQILTTPFKLHKNYTASLQEDPHTHPL